MPGPSARTTFFLATFIGGGHIAPRAKQLSGSFSKISDGLPDQNLRMTEVGFYRDYSIRTFFHATNGHSTVFLDSQ